MNTNRRMAVSYAEIKVMQQISVVGGISFVVGCMVGASIALGWVA